MQLDYLFILTIVFTLMLILIQRAEPGRRFVVASAMIVPAILLRNFINYREIQTEGWLALAIALFLNFMFWLLIGRYNPVHRSDEIRVLGLDD